MRRTGSAWVDGGSRMDASGRTDPVGPVPVDAGESARYEIVKDVVDELIDLTLNYRQSGHPGGSRSKVHFVLGTLLSGAMRWDVLRPWRTFSDRFVLSAGHTVPLVYAILATLNEAHARPPRPRRRRPLRLPGRWPLGPHLGGPAHLPAPRRPARPRGDGRQDTALQGQHRSLRPRHARRCRRGAGAQAGRLPGGQGLRRGRGRRPHARRHPRDAQLGLGPGPRQPRLPGRLERLRHRPARRLLGPLRHA